MLVFHKTSPSLFDLLCKPAGYRVSITSQPLHIFTQNCCSFTFHKLLFTFWFTVWFWFLFAFRCYVVIFLQTMFILTHPACMHASSSVQFLLHQLVVASTLIPVISTFGLLYSISAVICFKLRWDIDFLTCFLKWRWHVIRIAPSVLVLY